MGVDPRSPANRRWDPRPRSPANRAKGDSAHARQLGAGARHPSARPFQAPPDFQSALLPHCGRDGPDSANSRPGPSSVSGRDLKFGGECEARLLGSESGCRSQATCECQCGPLVACCAVRKATEPGSVTYEPPIVKVKRNEATKPEAASRQGISRAAVLSNPCPMGTKREYCRCCVHIMESPMTPQCRS
jgi:hypothetical protein